MKILAFTGAGISKQSNIPTFMERPDVREKLFRSYANSHHEEYNEVIRQLKVNMNGAKPNDAHIALAEYKIPVITMNIDGLHKLAGSDALEMHGGLPEDDEMDEAYSLYNKPVLYGDPAPNYQKAYEMVYGLETDDVFLVIGCSFHTAIAVDLREIARSRGARIIEIQEDAAHNVRKVLEKLIK
ncbi:MAG: transcriptional regulator [[Clostridium] spiroforme]|uniref:Sir2 family NAD-dependent protein deacetylase n=1 Tax=Thomasclavelia spiroformis TaxID=29348 RepID=UPI001DFF385C|nr:Sir2 family NAD-dependent protein deacetylase [Thomasclavelia spiroformis]MBS7216608.1 transcriptional regulator [Thomasclavelia spiroformis]